MTGLPWRVFVLLWICAAAVCALVAEHESARLLNAAVAGFALREYLHELRVDAWRRDPWSLL